MGTNEVGFTEDNVRAICDVGRSTKKPSGPRRQRIGERGLGFKSVFKAADKVWIRSRALEFCFDRNEPLGMVAPEWTSFKHPNSSSFMVNTTQYCLHVPNVGHQETLLWALRNLRREVLMFLRHIELIRVQIETTFGTYQDKFRIRRQHTYIEDIKQITVLRYTEMDDFRKARKVDSRAYLTFERTASHLPPQLRREKVTVSDVIVAFPVKSSKLEPLINTQPAFSMLPINIYGLPVSGKVATYLVTANLC
jgi:hypothetical protein